MGRVVLIKGSDEILIAAARTAIVKDFVGDGDASLLVTQFSGDDYEMRELIDAAQTLPFLTDNRIVVGVGISRFTKADHEMLAGYLADPLDTTDLVLEWGGSARIPKPLSEALSRVAAEIRETSPGRKLGEWAAQEMARADLKPDRAATQLVVDWLGDEGGKLPGLLGLLVSTFGPGARLTANDIEPFLGDAGGAPPWDLTDAIDRGDIRTALSVLHRMTGSGRHPLQVFASITSHITRTVRLDGSGARSEKEAANLLGLKGSTFPAKKALAQSRKLGSDRLGQQLSLLAAADLDLRGQTGWDHELVLEVLVARLARLGRAS